MMISTILVYCPQEALSSNLEIQFLFNLTERLSNKGRGELHLECETFFNKHVGLEI